MDPALGGFVQQKVNSVPIFGNIVNPDLSPTIHHMLCNPGPDAAISTRHKNFHRLFFIRSNA